MSPKLNIVSAGTSPTADSVGHAIKASKMPASRVPSASAHLAAKVMVDEITPSLRRPVSSCNDLVPFHPGYVSDVTRTILVNAHEGFRLAATPE